MSENAKTLALDALHRQLGAKMVTFAGYAMPIQYGTGVKAEHLHTRAQAGLFDVSHMGQIIATANDRTQATLHSQLEQALPLDFNGWPENTQRYSLLLNEKGGIEDDLMVANAGDQIRLVVNAGNRDNDMALLKSRCPELTFEWLDAALIAVQGPQAERIIAALDPQAASMTFMQTKELTLHGATCYTSRSGYTGEDGYEISIPAADAQRVVKEILKDQAAQPIGLGARDSLRLEAGLPLHGNDIGPDTTPNEAGLPFAIAKSRRAGGEKEGNFPGAETILGQFKNGTDRKLIGLASPEAMPIRAGATIHNDAGDQVGVVTSGTFSPTLNQPVVLAYVDIGVAKLGAEAKLTAKVRNKMPKVEIKKLPFVVKQYKR